MFMPKKPPYLHLKRSDLPASVRLGHQPSVLDEIADPQVQVVVWRPDWSALARKAMRTLVIQQLPTDLPRRSRWQHDDECDVYSFACTLRRRQNMNAADLWQEVLPKAPGYAEVAIHLATLTQAVMRHSPSRSFELLSSPGYYGGEQREPAEASKPRLLHLDAPLLKGFANLVGATTIGFGQLRRGCQSCTA